MQPLTNLRPAATLEPVRTATRLIAVTVLVLTLGLHWAFLQTVAWTGMLVRYSRDSSFTEAVSRTFDGKHPCRLCHLVREGKAEEQRQDAAPLTAKLDLGLPPLPLGFDFACERRPFPSDVAQAFARPEEPPKPRPRGVPHRSPA